MGNNTLERAAEEIKQLMPIEVYVEKYSKTGFSKAGKEWMTTCIFPGHEDGTPSFSVNVYKQLFKCHGCGKGGDIITLRSMLENITQGEAIKRFASELGINVVSEFTKEDEEAIKDRNEKTQIYVYALEQFQSRINLDHINFLKGKYGLTRETVELARIGFSGDGDFFETLTLASRAKTGFFKYDADTQQTRYFIKNRIMFPHFWRDIPIHFTNRDANPEGDPKYKSLNPLSCVTVKSINGESEKQVDTWAESGIPYFVPDSLVRFWDYLIIVEGIGDALALAQLGFAAIAIKNNRMQEDMLPYVTRYFRDHKFKKIIIWADFDPIKKEGKKVGAGEEGANATFDILLKNGQIASLMMVKHIDPERNAEKCDPADFVMSLMEHGKTESEAKLYIYDIIQSSENVLDSEGKVEDKHYKFYDVLMERIDKINITEVEEFIKKLITPIQSTILRERYIKEIVKKKKVSRKLIAQTIESEMITNPNNNIDKTSHFNEIPGEKDYNLLKSMGVEFFWDAVNKEMFMVDGKDRLELNAEDMETKGFLWKKLNMNMAIQSGKIKFEELKLFAFDASGKIVKKGGWLFRDEKITGSRDYDLYMGFSAKNNEIFKVTRGGIQKVHNPDALSGTMLKVVSTDDFKFSNLSNEQYIEGIKMLKTSMMDYWPMDIPSRFLMLCWFLACPLRDWADAIPALQALGSQNSGKTTAFKMFHGILFRNSFIGTFSSGAPLYEMSEQQALLVLDNYETAKTKEDIQDFLIIAATSGMRSKMDMTAKTGNKIKSVYMRALVGLTSIEPISQTEIVDRVLIVRTNHKHHRTDIKHKFNEILKNVEDNRDFLLSTWIHLIQRIMQGDVDSMKANITSLFFGKLKYKARMASYLSLMGIIMMNIGPALGLTTEEVKDIIESWIDTQEETAKNSMKSVSEIVTGLNSLSELACNLYAREGDLDELNAKHNIDIVTFGKSPTNEVYIEVKGTVSQVFRAITTACYQYRNAFGIKTYSVFGSRLINDKDFLQDEGWFFDTGKRTAKGVPITLKKMLGTGITRSSDVTKEELQHINKFSPPIV